MKILKCVSRGRAGLHLWTSGGVGQLGSRLKLPADVCAKDTHVCMGVNSMTLFSPHSAQLWHAPLHPSPSSPWHSSILPADSAGVKQVVSGLSHTLILTSSGRVYSMGKGYFGQTCGSLAASETALCRVAVPNDSSVKQIACGLDHSLLLLENGAVYACGWAADGQTGNASYEGSGQLVRVELSNRAVSIATCSDSCFAMTDQDEIFAWGNNEYRQLGVASEAPQLCLPEAVDCSAMDGGVTALAAGGAFTAFLSCKGSVYLAGYNIDAMQEAAKTPRSAHGPLLRQIHNAEVDARVSSLKAGLNYLLALTSSPSTGLIWGKLSLRKAMHCRTEFAVSPAHLAAGSLGVAAITGSFTSEILN